jgi:hypothetical protein
MKDAVRAEYMVEDDDDDDDDDQLGSMVVKKKDEETNFSCSTCFNLTKVAAMYHVLSREDLDLNLPENGTTYSKPSGTKSAGFQFSHELYEMQNWVEFCRCYCHGTLDPSPAMDHLHASGTCCCRVCKQKQYAKATDAHHDEFNVYALEDPTDPTWCDNCNDGYHCPTRTKL